MRGSCSAWQTSRMTRTRKQWVAGLASAAWLATAGAQDITEEEKPRMRALLSIATFDTLKDRCAQSGGFNEEQRAEVANWTRSQSVDRLRTHFQGPAVSDTWRQQARATASQVVQMIPAGLSPCAAAVSVIRLPDAQFADKLPELMAGGAAAAPRAPAPSAAAKSTVTPPSAGADAGNAARLAADIEGFAFDSCTRVGYGGMVMFAPCPVVLFRNGSALTDVEGLDHPRGLSAHRGEKPKSWTRWQRAGDRIQLLKSEGWKNITYTAVYSALPRDFRLDGRYHSSSGTGNTAMGGGQAVIAWSDYVFTPDGRVQRDGGAGSSTSGTGVSVTTAGSAPSKTGRYRIEGLVLAIDYDDGSRERRVIIADPKDAGKGTLWLDGEGYVYRK
jgi:hypothetical protein